MSVTIREPGSAITHLIGMMMAIIASTPLLIKAVLSGQPEVFAAMIIFIASMVLLYGASATYHSINAGGRILRVFRKIDHMMIFVLIAGSYTPICLVVLGGCASAPVDTTPVWQQQLPETGVEMEVSNCTLLGEEPVYYTLDRDSADPWVERPALQTEGVPVVTLRGVEPEQVELRFVENIDTLYLY